MTRFVRASDGAVVMCKGTRGRVGKPSVRNSAVRSRGGSSPVGEREQNTLSPCMRPPKAKSYRGYPNRQTQTTKKKEKTGGVSSATRGWEEKKSGRNAKEEPGEVATRCG